MARSKHGRHGSRERQARRSARPARAVDTAARTIRNRPLGLSFAASLGVLLLGASFVDPYSGAQAAEPIALLTDTAVGDTQTLLANGSQDLTVDRQAVGSAALPVQAAEPAAEETTTPVAVSVGTTVPVSDVQAYAREQVLARGWSEEDFSCLVLLWNKESHWNYQASNRSSGAYGIPQALPGSKMASAGADWQTNPMTQVDWGLGYVGGRYGTPCNAWAHSVSVGWY